MQSQEGKCQEDARQQGLVKKYGGDDDNFELPDDVKEFEKCKELAVRDEDTKQKIKYEEQNLKDCGEDKLCKKAVRQAINAYKAIRDDIKQKLASFTTK